jgi:hypothetical protein
MSGTLIESVHSAFSADVRTKISILLGESGTNIQKAIQDAVPLILTDILHKSYLPEANALVWDLSRQAATGDLFGELHELTISAGGLVPGSVLLNKGIDYARLLLDNRLDPVINEIGRHSGISIPSASFITGIVSFATLDSIGRHIAMYNVDAPSMGLWIRTQTENIRLAIPTGLQVKEALGLHRHPWETHTATKRSRNVAMYVALLLIIIVATAFILFRNHQNDVTITTSDTTAPATPSRADTGTVR